MSSSRTRQLLLPLVVASIALSSAGCLFPARREIEARAPLFQTVTFDSATDLVILPSIYGADTVGVLAGVTELGGRIDEAVGDTLVIHPIYALVRDPNSPGISRYGTTGRHRLPDRVVVIVQSGTTVKDFRKNGNELLWTHNAFEIAILMYLVFTAYRVNNH